MREALSLCGKVLSRVACGVVLGVPESLCAFLQASGEAVFQVWD